MQILSINASNSANIELKILIFINNSIYFLSLSSSFFEFYKLKNLKNGQHDPLNAGAVKGWRIQQSVERQHTVGVVTHRDQAFEGGCHEVWRRQMDRFLPSTNHPDQKHNGMLHLTAAPHRNAESGWLHGPPH